MEINHKVKSNYCAILLLFLFHVRTINAAFEDLPAGARSLGMASAFTAVAEGSESLLTNPAGLAQSSDASLCLFYSRPFGLQELTYEIITSVLPTRFGNWGLGFQGFGNTLYRESTAVIGWSHHLHHKFYFGIGIRSATLRIEKYGSDNAFIFDTGCILKLANHCQWGVSVSNLFQSRIGKNEEPLPQIMRTGLCYRPFQGILFSIEIDKDVRYPIETRAGAEICPLSLLTLRFGFGREPDFFSAGFGLTWKYCIFDYAFTTHPVLGTTHQASVSLHIHSVQKKSFRIP
jgi:hypothetical protein